MPEYKLVGSSVGDSREKEIMSSTGWRWLRIFGLSALLLGLQGAFGGFFYETNDDLLMELLLRGINGAAPVSNLQLYLHGWSQLLATLYTWFPTIPWYALLLYVLLYASLTVFFWTLDVISCNRLNSSQTALVQIVFYGLTYFLHAVQINFTRPALLLGASAGLLLLVPRRKNLRAVWSVWLLAGFALIASWALRPSGAALGLVLTLPLVLWHGWGRGAKVISFLCGLLLALTGIRILAEAPEAKLYRHLDLERSQLFDYRTSTLEVHTPLDSLAYSTLVPYMGLNDSVLINPAFFKRAMTPILKQGLNIGVNTNDLIVVAGSIGLRLSGCLLLIGFGLLVVMRAMRQGLLRNHPWQLFVYFAYQPFFGIIVLVLSSHLPLRVLQPIVTIYTLVNLIIVFGLLLPKVDILLSVVQKRWLLGTVLVMGMVWLVVNLRLVRQLSRDNATQDAYLAQLEKEVGPNLLIEQGLYAAYSHLSPLGEHHLQHYRKIMMLTGWPAFDPSQPRLRSSLAGTRDLALALLYLGQQPTTNWALQPSFARLLGQYINERLTLPLARQVHFEPVVESSLPTSDSNPPRRFRLVQNQ